MVEKKKKRKKNEGTSEKPTVPNTITSYRKRDEVALPPTCRRAEVLEVLQGLDSPTPPGSPGSRGAPRGLGNQPSTSPSTAGPKTEHPSFNAVPTKSNKSVIVSKFVSDDYKLYYQACM